MNYLDDKKTIGSVVAELPEASKIFSEFGIDFCCGGHRLLSFVVKEQGIDEQLINQRLNQALEERQRTYQNQENGFNEMSHSALSTYIEDKHHNYLREALPKASDLLNTILRVHGKNHKELFEVYRLFGGLKSDLEQHLLKEETFVFPAFVEEEKNQLEIKQLCEEIIKEHEAAGEILSELRRVTNNYELPDDACQTYHMTYELLEEIEKDLHQHIHLENNILFKNYDVR